MSRDEDPKTEELRVAQSSKARDERRQAQEAVSDDEAKTHDRRAEKAAYLAGRLAQQERSEEEKSQ